MSKTEITYHWEGGYQIPNLIAEPAPEVELERYGRMHMKWLREIDPEGVREMKRNGELLSHCVEVQERAKERLWDLMDQIAAREGVDEALKASDQMEWVRQMNNIKSRAEEIVLDQIVFSL